MPFIPVADVAQAELIYSWSGQVVETVLHYQIPAGWNQVEMEELAADLVTWWDTHMQPVMPTTLQLNMIRVTDLSAVDAEFVNWSTGLPLVGTNASPSLPNNCALTITKRTPQRGRSFRGRIYHPGLVEAAVVDNTVTAAQVSLISSVYALAKTFPIQTETAQMVVVSRFTNGNPRAAGIWTPVTTFTSDGLVDSQRRRLPGRGN